MSNSNIRFEFLGLPAPDCGDLEGRYLRRPISICDWDEGSITLIYKVVGEGTERKRLV